MKSWVRCLLIATVFAALLSFIPLAFGQSQVAMSFDGYYSAVSCNGPDGCVGAGLYGGSINGVNVGPGQSVPGMVCDDYFDHIYTGETWKANGIDVANLNAGNIASLTMFGASIGVQGYTELAYLVSQMFFANPSQAQQAALSEAIWFITSGGTSGGLTGQALTYYNCVVSLWSQGKISLSQFANLYLYTPSVRGSGEPQEMWSLVPVPEGGSALMYLLLGGITCIAAMRLRTRRQPS